MIFFVINYVFGYLPAMINPAHITCSAHATTSTASSKPIFFVIPMREYNLKARLTVAKATMKEQEMMTCGLFDSVSNIFKA